MKQLLPKFWAKFVAGLLFVVMALLFAASAFGVAGLAFGNAYVDGGRQMRERVLETKVQYNLRIVADYYSTYLGAQEQDGASDMLDNYQEQFSRENSNYFFTVTDADGNVLLSNYTDDYQYSENTQYMVTPQGQEPVHETRSFADETEMYAYVDQLIAQYGEGYLLNWEESSYTNEEGEEQYQLDVEYTEGQRVTITGYVRSELEAKDDIYYSLHWLDKLIGARNWLLAIAIVTLVLMLALLVFLLAGAGHREGEPGIQLTGFDRIPLDLLLVCYIVLGCFSVMVLDNAGVWQEVFLCGGLLVLCGAPLVLLFLISCASRIKAKTFWKNTVICWLLVGLKKCLLWLWHGVVYVARALPLYWKAGVFWLALSLVELIFILSGDPGGIAVLWLIEKLVFTVLLIVVVINMRKLQEGAKRIAAGEVDYTVDLNYLYGDFKAHGKNLNSIRDGLQAAVDERVKSERMKAELITNVSHDIKTPLTSIVNYVDLLKKEELGSDTAREYVEVLERQAQRLKKLTEDLVEASKASTGNIPVHLERTDLNVLIAQTEGEFADRFATQKLELRVTAAQEQTCVMADGRLLWRVFSNLMSNVGKYALEGTRVYLTIEVQHGRAIVSVKNISRYPLNVTGEELMERFVRGDKSRSTEGSGLGLSIARSLTELQGGVFDIVIDGDLFKATISFPIA